MRWLPWANLFLGCWLFCSPFAFGLKFSPLFVSDLLAGFLAAGWAAFDLSYHRSWTRWAICIIGIWLLFAPLLFWTPSAAVYSNDTLVGILLILFAVDLPSQSHPVSEIPPGWSYNPSDWHHRIPVIVLAFIGFFIARVMAAYQLGHTRPIWDPFFGNGTSRVLTSNVAKAFPISDAGLGAATYLLEALSGLVGDGRRWRTMPWMVFLFFVLVAPAGVVSIVLIMLQPVVVGSWCTLCLLTALTTLISIPPAVDEVFAATQCLLRARREGKLLSRVFWLGDHETGTVEKKRPDSRSINGVKMGWPLLASATLGIGTVVMPAFIDLPPRAADNAHIVGALVATFAVLATAEPIRPLRFLNAAFGLWMCITPFVWKTSVVATSACVAIGILLIALSFPRGKIEERYGTWDRYIF